MEASGSWAHNCSVSGDCDSQKLRYCSVSGRERGATYVLLEGVKVELGYRPS